MVIGILSDTHSTLSERVLTEFKRVDHICHAGDIGDPQVLKTLQTIAPTHSVRGNMDGGAWSKSLPPNDLFKVGGTLFYVVHDLHMMDIDPKTAGVKVVISGHTHQPEIRNHDGILYFNPGSASFGRYGSPPSIGLIELAGNKIIPKIVMLDVI